MLSVFDKALLNLLQDELPLCSRPFAVLAERLGVDEQTVLLRLQMLQDHGYIRRIGPFFDSSALGYTGTLVALQVQPDCLPLVARQINRYPGATHNYERTGMYNLWFTLLTPDSRYQQIILAEIHRLPGVQRMMNLVSQHKYKIQVQFQLE